VKSNANMEFGEIFVQYEKELKLNKKKSKKSKELKSNNGSLAFIYFTHFLSAFKPHLMY
jgi:hypothetical protein